jgi:hypothetical protein
LFQTIGERKSLPLRGEIETAMREGNGSKYWADVSMQREYGEILSRQAGPGPTAPAPNSASPPDAAAEPAGM